MTAAQYHDEVVDLIVKPYAAAVGFDFHFMDNAHPHQINIVEECMESESISHME